ncbi:vitamin B12 dependent methionine synthase [Desulfosporosinus meridiei]|uniref:Vitamin B12 dependent methionine synthase n=1 Tax=Desulfosporosinus meridiei (strain ATCC BAA-275 / DSM 13257 / KCTC 12902 / NCIMB 13706 / S10) TaxID=768704 RepID=J7IVW4_DESMD|nr:vitamin B12 dependent methionine synthase [Desulfosporosinus meridiei]AFQ45875.1 vitamin B12 dependent methionine synthase [Desulfosporosinus meridiei DSM 13257]
MDFIKWDNLQLDTSEIYRRIGMPDAYSKRSRNFKPTIEEMRLKALGLVDARCIYAYVPVEVSGSEEILLANKYAVKAATSFFEGAHQVLLAIQTIGPRLEEESARLFEQGEMLEGMVLDGCGTVALDEALELLRGMVVKEVTDRGLQTGHNLCPGGYQIPLEAQKVLFTLLDGGELGISLSETLLMSPVKSHTLVIPVGEKLKKPNLSCAITCEMCVEQQNCAHSRLKFGKSKEPREN